METTFDIELRLEEGYRFTVDFGDGIPTLLVDEPPPLGEGAGPNPSRLLAAAVANCLAASALFCLRKARVEVTGMKAHARARLARDLGGRLRVETVAVTLEPEVADAGRLDRCLDLFEDFCIVTQSVRNGFDVEVEVNPASSASSEGAGRRSA